MSRDPRNAPGDFYVERDCCTLCGVPWHIAPELFKYDDKGCWVARQPVEPVEERKMIEVITTQELGCVRYSSTRATILDALAETGARDQCDHPAALSAWSRFRMWITNHQH